MQITCPKCGAQYNVDESRIPPQGVTIKCPRCLHQFVVQLGDDEDDAATEAISAVDVAAAAAAPPPAASGWSGGAPGSTGPVPLPGARAGIPSFAEAEAFAPPTLNNSEDVFGAPTLAAPPPRAMQTPGVSAASVPLPGFGGPGFGASGFGNPVPLPGAAPNFGGSVPLPGAAPNFGGSAPLPGAGAPAIPMPGATPASPISYA